ncbi:MAG: ribulose-phosphate 3-epimerase [Candidatus Hydrogenedentota bacterium]
MSDIGLSLNLDSLNVLRMDEELSALAAGGAPELYCAVSDGVFAPLMGHGPYLIRSIAERGGDCPLHVHLLCENPDAHIGLFAEMGLQALTVHAEPVTHIHRTLTRIREVGLEAGVALKPGVPLTRLEYVLEYADRIVVLAAEPGFPQSPLGGGTYDRVRILRQNLDYLKLNASIEVLGPVSPLEAARFAHLGAHRVCVDLSAQDGAYSTAVEGLQRFREELERQMPVA